jgi:dTDP-4-dehydrorhamnose reductase
MYVVIGANGFLGSYLIKSIIENTADTVIAAARKIEGLPACERVLPVNCDITSVEDVDALAEIIRQGEPCKLIYLAAYHNLDLVAQYPKTAWDINITSLASFINSINNLSCFFFSSTDCVYGEGRPEYRFKECDPLLPISLYGVHKAAAECLVKARGYNVLRLPYMFGPSFSRGKKHFYDVLAEDLTKGKKVNLFYDSLRSSLDFETVADLFVRLAENYPALDLPAVLNLCGDDCLSKYDLGVMLAKKLGAPAELVQSVSSLTLETAPDAARAFNGLMDNSLLKSTLGIPELKIKI